MSRKYEGMIVLNTKTIEGSVEDLVAAVSKEIEAEGAKLDEVQQLESGHYVNYFFKAEPDAIDRIQSRLKLNGHVHLQHFQRVA
jgi:small subunit ribosomal protein S6